MRFGLKAILVFCMPLVFIIAMGMQSQAEVGSVENGMALYKKCSGCHGEVAKFAAKPADYLTDKMMKYRDGSFDKPKVKAMQQAFKGMSDKDLADLTAYIKTMK